MPLIRACFVVLQSITVPLQGFLNAIVYGWTREDFVQAVRSQSVNTQNEDDKLFRDQGSVSYDNGFLNSTADSTHTRSVVAPRDFLFSIPEQEQQ